MLCGIDEAGRGPVIGNMVMAGFMLDKPNVLEGVKDSKMLSAKRRLELFSWLRSFRHVIIEITPDIIDDYVRRKALNWLEAETSARIINELRPKKVIVDCPSNNLEAYKDYLVSRLIVDVEVVVEHKADEKYPVVGAASILAKVTRDTSIKALEKRLGKRIGSGYPSDPITQQFLKGNWKSYPGIFRKSWETYKKLLQASLEDF